jgi:CubicO group peptidase (beta-lactamase class C family)
MKKILIIFISLMLTLSAQANEGDLWGFGTWLTKNNLNSLTKINDYKNRSEIPEDVKPNFDTLLFYYWKYTNRNWNSNPKYTDIKASENPYKFESNLREDAYVKKQMQKTALLSYLLFEDGKIVIDEISPKDKFGKVFTNETKYHSQSVGKSFASYILGHAICKGYVDGIDSKLNDWPILENTLYYDQKIIDVINMKAGDGKYFSPKDRSNRFDVTISSSRYSVTNRTIPSVMLREFKGSKKSGSKWAYNNLLPHLILNYIIFKIGEDDFKDLLNEIFREKVGIEYDATLVASEESGVNNKSTTSTFLTTRYDYLRIARAMLVDWQNDTCEGKYLKSLFERKVKKNFDYRNKNLAFTNTKSYGGFFHLEPSGMKKRHIFVMDGYGGQTLMIDFDTGRIVTTMAVHRNFNWKKIAHSVIKKGK